MTVLPAPAGVLDSTEPVGAGDPVLAAVAVLPLSDDDADRRWNLRTATAAWLRSRRSDHTRRAYWRELAGWLAWCERTGLDPRAARRGDVDAYLSAAGGRTGDGRALAATSQARRLSALSSWYRYLISNGATDANPVEAVDRPEVNRDSSPTLGLDDRQITLFMRAARAATTPAAVRDAALTGMLAELALRVGEVLALDLADVRHNRGHRTVRVRGKGGRFRELPIPAPLGRILDAYLAARAAAAGVPVDQLDGPLFVTRTGKRLNQPAVYGMVRRIARAAGLPAAAQLSPHSLRHSAATAMFGAGATLRDVQDALGHADPRTTRRYDRDRHNLDRSPVYLIAGLFAHDDAEHDRAEHAAASR